jgi:hypothetical protein
MKQFHSSMRQCRPWITTVLALLLPACKGSMSGAQGSLVALQPTADQPWSKHSCEEHASLSDADEDDLAIVCVDLINGQSVRSAPRHNVLAPNQAVAVVVRHDPAEKVMVDLSGERGITSRIVQSTTKAARPRPPPNVHYSASRFSPRKPGSADLEVKIENSGAEVPVLELELEVEEHYWGAVRFGVGTVLGDFHGYDITTVADAETAQIRESDIPVQFELVTGFAFYPEAIKGGRGYVAGPNWYWSPYIGFGLVGQSAKDITAFTSFHAGIDFEFARDFSLAATFVLKSTRVLSDGYSPGSPIDAATAEDRFTEASFVPGGAIVFSASPSFLQFATGNGNSKEGN